MDYAPIDFEVADNNIHSMNVKLTAGTNTAFSLNDGSYVLTNLPQGSYTVTPSQDCSLFIPVTRSVTLLTNDSVNNDFAAIANNVFAVRGRVMEGP